MAKLGPSPGSSEITPESLYLRRREFLLTTARFTATAIAVGGPLTWLMRRGRAGGRARSQAAGSIQATNDLASPNAFTIARREPFGLEEPPNSYDDVTTYNNFYEFGTGKGDPAENAHTLRPRPWTVTIDGEVRQPRMIDMDRLLKLLPLEERVYRMRCVEGWSLVVPWVGFQLGDLLKMVEPTSRAKYVELTTLHDPEQMPGQRSGVLPWPYVEALRIDEAMHPLTILAVGLYGKMLPNQNGAPLRLVVPWKYGFKGVKSIVRIRLVLEQPVTTWNRSAPSEYGFYANVNPAVDHPRWSQATERRIGEFARRPTLPFNGYAEQVASLYTGMDLARNF